jgi:F420-0:gamma-glutamyl ligase-like protein
MVSNCLTFISMFYLLWIIGLQHAANPHLHGGCIVAKVCQMNTIRKDKSVISFYLWVSDISTIVSNHKGSHRIIDAIFTSISMFYLLWIIGLQHAANPHLHGGCLTNFNFAILSVNLADFPADRCSDLIYSCNPRYMCFDNHIQLHTFVN